MANTVQLCAALAPESVSQELLDAIRCVESKGDICAVGDNGRSIGAYQIMRNYYTDALSYLSTAGKGTLYMYKLCLSGNIRDSGMVINFQNFVCQHCKK